MAFKSLPGDDLPAVRECKNFIDVLLELGGVPGLYSHYDRRLYAGKLGIGLSIILTKNVRVSEMYTTADRIREYCMRADLAVVRGRCTHIAYVADTCLRVDTAVASRHIAEGASLQSAFGQYSLEKAQGGVPNPLESKAAILSAWSGLLVHLPLGQPSTFDHTHTWTCVLLSAVNFLDSMLALQDHQVQPVWTGNFGVVWFFGTSLDLPSPLTLKAQETGLL